MEYLKLGEISKFIMGQAPNSENCNKNGSGTIFVKAGQFGKLYPNIEEWTVTPLKLAKENDVLICVVGATVGKLNLAIDCAIGRSVAAIRCDSKKLHYKYLYYYLNTWITRIRELSQGSAIGVITKDMLYDLNIPMYDISSQIYIVNILDKAQKLMDKRKQQIEALDELVKSQFIEMFGDPFNDEKGFGINKLGEVTVVNPKKAEIKDLDKKLLVSFVPMDRVGEKGEFNPEVSKSIGEVYSGFTYFRENDVLFAKITPCMENGKGAVAVNLSNGIGFGSTEFHVLRPLREKSNSYWIYYLTTLIEFRRLAERKMTGSAGQKRVPTDFLNNIRVVVPPIELQNKFVQFTKQVDKLKFEMEKSLKELEDNFNALMQRAFKGELFS